MYTESQLASMLHEAKIRPSLHRLAVLTYVANQKTHPTADEIYNRITTDYPGTSRTTVYNSLHALSDGGILRELDLESGNTRYDLANQQAHSHFTCKICGQIFDMALPDKLSEIVATGFQVTDINLHFNGICPACKENIKQSDLKLKNKQQ